ncbi:TetR/AcrR family transcriptional regulator [Aquamicrobium sp. LC103]|nr:TetR/AcrR family transcriptional regulator [Aquamicrobium sp. LC103]
MKKDARGAKRKILEAAEAIAREVGPGNLSLDAVAARAGVSKGGLLYHFPNKAKLVQSLVESFLREFEEALSAREEESDGAPNSVVDAYMELFLQEHKRRQPPPASLLAALAEDQDFVTPVRRYQRAFLDRMKSNAENPTMAMIAYLSLHGIRSMELLNLEIIDEKEFAQVMEGLRKLVGCERDVRKREEARH